MTEKLFYNDPYICEAQCKVIDVIQKKDTYEIVLDKTPFFPEGGGQLSDKGYIDDIKVDYVYEKDDLIYHITKVKPQNNTVKCIVDFHRRFDLTQQHSGEHLISAAFYKLYNAKNAGFHLGDEYLTVDIEIHDITKDMIAEVEKQANSYVFQNKPVNTYFLQKEEALKLPLRKEIKASGNIRMVVMGDGLDYSACCGTHVKNTSEVGIIKIIKYEKYKGMTRVYAKCGVRALKDYQIKHEYVTDIAKLFSVEQSGIVNKVQKQKADILELKKQINSMYSKMAVKEADELIKRSNSNIITDRYIDEGFEYLDKIYENLKDKKYIILLSSLKDKKILLAQNGEFSMDCGKLFKENLKEFQGKGGGNKKRAQASFQNENSLKEFENWLEKKII
ncbi:MAG: alanine--tRNA ligase-related protein [Clostridiaceae bacterium]